MPKKTQPFPRISPDMRQNRPGPGASSFTLVELLIALSIFSVVSIAIYSTFSSGLGVLRKVKDIDLAQQSFALKIERFSREIRQNTRMAKLYLSGADDRISFGQVSDDAPLRLTYYFDSASQCFMRATDNLADILKEGKIDPELKSKGTVFLKNVKEARFSYLFFDLKKKAYLWSQEWKETTLPLAVKLNIVTDKQNYATTVFLPTA